MELQLIVDTRERALHRFLTHHSFVQVKQITHGDFNILVNGRLVATIERKTVSDYAASIKDGRTSNKHKLLSLREQTGCQIYYIVEGNLHTQPNPNTEFNGIKWSAIEHSMLHLQTEHYIMVQRTYGGEDSARYLIELSLSFARRPAYSEELGLGIFETPKNLNESTVGGDLELLTARVDKSRHEQIVAIWKSVPGIGLQSAIDLSDRPIYLVLCTNPVYLYNAGGKQFSKLVQDALRQLSDPSINDHQKKFLAGFPNLGQKKAIELLVKYQSLRGLITALADNKNALNVIAGYGEKTSEKICDLLFQ